MGLYHLLALSLIFGSSFLDEHRSISLHAVSMLLSCSYINTLGALVEVGYRNLVVLSLQLSHFLFKLLVSVRFDLVLACQLLIDALHLLVDCLNQVHGLLLAH
jgi:hypothetical protein